MRSVYIILILIFLIPLNARENLSEDSEYIDIYVEKRDGGGYLFYGDNRHFIPQFVSLGFPKLVNLKLDGDDPALVTLPPETEKILIAELIQIDKNKSYSFRSRLSYTHGDPNTVKPDDYLYIFPYKHGDKYKLDQGFGGKFSHFDENLYALDFSMDVGTPVHAARDGVVIDVKEDSNRRGKSQAFAKYGNYISILHSDGTFASYVHLKLNGAVVEVGDEVKEGDMIGFSGNTGLTTGPHLHFSVNIPSREGVRQSIPIKFRGIDGLEQGLYVGEYYYSSHRDKGEFEVSYGKDIRNEDYDDYFASVSKTGKLSFRTEEVDSTRIIFCSNGYDKEVEGDVGFSLRNSVTSKPVPITVKIPPLTEVYICLVRPKDRTKPFSLSYSISFRIIE